MRCRPLAAFVLMLALTACRAAPSQEVKRTEPAGPAPTFAKDIAPILYTNCVPCHRPGQPASFPLIEYGDVKNHADKIAKATGTGRMPPWLPAPAEYAFVGERRLRADQIALIRRWVETGAIQGDPADLP